VHFQTLIILLSLRVALATLTFLSHDFHYGLCAVLAALTIRKQHLPTCLPVTGIIMIHVNPSLACWWWLAAAAAACCCGRGCIDHQSTFMKERIFESVLGTIVAP